jgi:hypothetical protein
LVETEATDPSWRKWRPSDPAPIHWYDLESFNRRIAATIAADRKDGRSRTLREFIAEFRGCARTDIQKQILDVWAAPACRSPSSSTTATILSVSRCCAVLCRG